MSSVSDHWTIIGSRTALTLTRLPAFTPRCMFGLENMKSSPTPMSTGVKFTKADMPEHVDERRRDTFRRMLGVAHDTILSEVWLLSQVCYCLSQN